MLRSLYLLMLLGCVNAAWAQSAEQSLQRKLATIKTFAASFEQQVFDANQQLLQQGKGELMIKQPALFRFETTTTLRSQSLSRRTVLLSRIPKTEEDHRSESMNPQHC